MIFIFVTRFRLRWRSEESLWIIMLITVREASCSSPLNFWLNRFKPKPSKPFKTSICQASFSVQRRPTHSWNTGYLSTRYTTSSTHFSLFFVFYAQALIMFESLHPIFIPIISTSMGTLQNTYLNNMCSLICFLLDRIQSLSVFGSEVQIAFTINNMHKLIP